MKCDECHRVMQAAELDEIVVDGLQLLHCSSRCAFVGGMRFAAALAEEQIDKLPGAINVLATRVRPAPARGSTEGGAL